MLQSAGWRRVERKSQGGNRILVTGKVQRVINTVAAEDMEKWGFKYMYVLV